MADIRINGVRLHYTDSGGSKPPLLFAHGLLWSGRMFAAQVAALEDRYRCITYDHRGQGASETSAGGYDMDSLADDAAALIEALEIAPCHFVGLSMGGFVGLRLAARRPELLRSLTLLDTSADAESRRKRLQFKVLNRALQWLGPKAVATPVLNVMFGPSFLNDPQRQGEREAWRRELLANGARPVAKAVSGVLRRRSVVDELDQIRCPTLIAVGDEDRVTPFAKAQRMRDRIDGATLVQIPRAGHSSTIEQPAAVTAAIADFLARVEAPNAG